MVIRCIVAAILVGLVGAYSWDLRSNRSLAGRVPSFERLPREVSHWSGDDLTTDEQVAKVLAADATLNRCYRRTDGAQVWVFAAYFVQQQVNSQIHSPRNCIPGEGWRVQSAGRESIPVNGKTQPALRMLITRGEAAEEVLYWLRSMGGTFTGEYAFKWDLVRGSLARRPTNAAFVRYNAETTDSTATRELMGLLQPYLDQILGDAGLQ
jgi:EpsI family protein